MSSRNSIRLALAAAAVAAAGACATAPPPPPDAYYVNEAPPAIQTEVVPVAPGPDYIWVGGGWTWGPSRSYVWAPGSWQRPPHAKARWVKSEWRHTSKGWYHVDGHWR